MDIDDPAVLRTQAQKLGLVTEEQILEICEELGSRNPELHELLRALERKRYLTPWQSNKLLKGDTDGYYLGGYRLLYKIASGSFGRVFRADEPASGRIVAVKVLRRRWSEDKTRIDLFAREGKVGLSLKHENIVEVLAVSQDPASGQYFIVMEFVEGGNLREILQIRKTLGVAEALRILHDAAAGLAYAYTRGVTHRDIKLTNLLISSTGTAKLVDFGLAQFYAAADKQESMKVDRTVDYAGLERATGVKPGDVRSDIFFLGCVLYETLSGRSPLAPSRDRNARMQRERFLSLAPLRPEDAQAPPSVFALVETMMSLDPHRRYQTPSQLLDAVRSALREVEGRPAGGKGGGGRTLFVVERDERLQDTLREKFKESGYRVLISADPSRALDRYRQQPFDGLIIDAGTTGEDGRDIFAHLLSEAGTRQSPLAGVLILSEEQADWARQVPENARAVALVRPVTMKQLRHALQELMEPQGSAT